jgi:hypothetical protein
MIFIFTPFFVTFHYLSSSKRGGGTPFLQDDNSNRDEAHCGEFSPIITRVTAKRNAEGLAAFQQITQVSPSPSTSKGKEPEYNPSPEKTPDQLRLDRIETMMEHIQNQESSLLASFLGSSGSSYRSSRSTSRLDPSIESPINCGISYEQSYGFDHHGRTRSIVGRRSRKVQSGPSCPGKHSG